MALDIGPHLAQGAVVSEGTQMTLNLKPLALEDHCLLMWIPCLLHGVPLAPDLGPQPALGAP